MCRRRRQCSPLGSKLVVNAPPLPPFHTHNRFRKLPVERQEEVLGQLRLKMQQQGGGDTL